jgi:hypothetical protein
LACMQNCLTVMNLLSNKKKSQCHWQHLARRAEAALT